LYVGDFHAEWNRLAGLAGYQVVDITGQIGTPKQQHEKGTVLIEDDVTEFSIPNGSTLKGVDPANIQRLSIEGYNRFGVPTHCYEQADVTVLAFPQPCPNLAGPDAHNLFCSGNVAAGDVDVGTYLDIDIGPSSPIDIGTPFSVCLLGSSLAQGAGTCDDGFFHAACWTTVASIAQQMPGRVATGAYACYGVPQGWLSAPVANAWMAQSVTRDNENLDYHMNWGAGQASANLVNTSTSAIGDLFDTDLSPGLLTRNGHAMNIFGGCGDGAVFGGSTPEYDHFLACKRGYITVYLPTNFYVRIRRTAGWFYGDEPGFTGNWVQEQDVWPGQPATPVAGVAHPGFGTGHAGSGNNAAPVPYDIIEIANASIQLQETWVVPGGVHPGDVYEYDTAQIFPNGGCAQGTSPTGDLCKHESGLLSYSGAAPFSQIPAGWVSACGTYNIESSGRIGSDGLARAALVYQSWADPEWYMQSRVWWNGGTAPRPGVGAWTGAADRRAAFRVDELDSLAAVKGTLGTTTGVNTGNLSTFIRDSLDNIVATAGTAGIRVTRMARGTSPGEVCHDKLQVNVGKVCCSPTPPIILPDLPPIHIDCLQTAGLLVTAVGTCAAGTGVQLRITWAVDSSVCDDGQYHLEFYIYEETDPSGFPGSLDLVHSIIPAPMPVSTGLAIVQLRDEQLWAGAPLPGVRGSDATGSSLSSAVRELQVTVRVEHNFSRNQAAVKDTNRADSPSAYADCP
jgi:hypothetical protein